MGPHLARLLLNQNHTVSGIIRVRSDRVLPKRLVESDLIGKVKLYECDIRDIYALNDIVDKVKPDWTFHLASQSFVPYSTTNPCDTDDTNATGTTNLLEVLRKRAPQSRLIFAGSSEEYGKQYGDTYDYLWENAEPHPNFENEHESEFPINEDNPLRPQTLYGVTKLYGDYMCQVYRKTFGLHTVISRAFNHEGYGRAPQFVTAKVIRQMCAIKAGETNQLHIGDTSAARDWSHVADICNGYLLMAERGVAGRVYVQGSGVARTVQEFINIADGLIKPGAYQVIQSTNPRPAEIPYLRADPGRIERELGWARKYTIEDIVNDLYDYYKIQSNRSNLMV